MGEVLDAVSSGQPAELPEVAAVGELVFLVMDPGYNPENRALIEENARTLGIPITVFNSDIFDVLFLFCD